MYLYIMPGIIVSCVQPVKVARVFGEPAAATIRPGVRGARSLENNMVTSSGAIPRPIIMGIVGDSAAGKTTLSRGIVQILGSEHVSVLCTDDYHRYNRQQRKELGITPLNPECNYLDIMAQHLRLLRAGEPILKPHYEHKLGDFGPPQYLVLRPFLIVEGLLGFYSQEMRNAYSVRVYLNPPEELRQRWKVGRDSTHRGYSEQEVLRELGLAVCVRHWGARKDGPSSTWRLMAPSPMGQPGRWSAEFWTTWTSVEPPFRQNLANIPTPKPSRAIRWH